MSDERATRRALLAGFDRFDARAVAWFLRVFGVAVVVDVATEVAAGVWRVHTGELYPWRYLGILPLYPARGLAIEWSLRVLAGLGYVLGARRPRVVALATRVAAVVLFVAVLERFSNHAALLFLVAFFLSIAPPDVTSPDFDARDHPALGLVRAQLALVYVFSALNKVLHGFGAGDSLTNVLANAGHAGAFGPRAASLLSWAVIGVELALPLLLVKRPRAGVAAVAAVHLAFAALVPGIASFGLAMLAIAILFCTPRPALTTA